MILRRISYITHQYSQANNAYMNNYDKNKKYFDVFRSK